MLPNADEGGGVKFSIKKRYEGVRFNVISIMRGWVGVTFPGEKHYVTLEWPHNKHNNKTNTQFSILLSQIHNLAY